MYGPIPPMVYVTGDLHGDFERVSRLCVEQQTTKHDVLIVLGDAGINYWGDKRDRQNKEFLQSLPITLFCIHGNHENRPRNIDSYRIIDMADVSPLPNCCGPVYQEPDFPNILFAIDGAEYIFDYTPVLTLGGAYSVDKIHRLKNGLNWWPDEQMDEERMSLVRELISICRLYDHSIPYILSHTCPEKYVPTEAFLPYVDQSSVDRRTEKFFDEVHEMLPEATWLCGHWHINKVVDNVRFVYDDIVSLEGARRSFINEQS